MSMNMRIATWKNLEIIIIMKWDRQRKPNANTWPHLYVKYRIVEHLELESKIVTLRHLGRVGDFGKRHRNLAR